MLQYVETFISIDTNYQNAFAFLLAFSRMGKTQLCTNYTVQLSNEAEFYTLLGTKLSSIITTWGRTFFLTEITAIPNF